MAKGKSEDVNESLEAEIILVNLRRNELVSQLDRPESDNDHVWQEIYGMIDRKLQLVDAEFNRRVAEQYRRLNESIPQISRQFNEVIELYIPDLDTRRAIQLKIEELFDVIKGSWDNPHDA